MSAFQVTPEHIGALIRFYLENERYPRFDSSSACYADAERMMSELALENWRSVAYRYDLPLDGDEQPVLCNAPLRMYRKLTPVQAIKAADCLDYQSCEHPQWDTCRAKRLLDDIRSLAISKLPGYDTADWAIDNAVEAVR